MKTSTSKISKPAKVMKSIVVKTAKPTSKPIIGKKVSKSPVKDFKKNTKVIVNTKKVRRETNGVKGVKKIGTGKGNVQIKTSKKNPVKAKIKSIMNSY